jgi:hypothetical protein
MSRSRQLSTLALLTIAVTPLACDSGENPLNPHEEEFHQGALSSDQSDAEQAFLATTPAELHRLRDEISRQEAAAAADSSHDNIERQAALTQHMLAKLPSAMPSFATESARTTLAELSGDGILSRLGYAAISSHSLEGDKDVYDDGTVRLRVSRSVPGYFKFADRTLLDEANKKVATETPVSAEVIERNAADFLAKLGVPASEIGGIRARAVTLDTGNRAGEVFNYGTAAYVTNVKRHIQGLPVLGSACTMAFDVSGRLTWTRCRWPQYQVAEEGTKAKARSYQEVLAGLAHQEVLAGLAQKLDRAMPPSANVADFNISTDFAYAEQVTTNGVFYVPVLRAILVRTDGGGAGEFLESISGIPLQ